MVLLCRFDVNLKPLTLSFLADAMVYLMNIRCYYYEFEKLKFDSYGISKYLHKRQWIVHHLGPYPTLYKGTLSSSVVKLFAKSGGCPCICYCQNLPLPIYKEKRKECQRTKPKSTIMRFSTTLGSAIAGFYCTILYNRNYSTI